MKKYGDTTPLYTRGVAMYIIFFSLILGLQWFVDSWAWGNTWGFTYASGDNLGWIWSRILGVMFATVILIFEILYLTQDTSTATTQGDAFRLLFALFVGWGLTSVAVEVSWFAPDIEKSIIAEEKLNIDNVVKAANATEEEKCNQLLTAAKAELGENATAEATKAQADLDRYIAERKAQHDILVAAADKARTEARTEAAGQISGRYGNGPAAKMMEGQAKDLAAELNPFDAQTATEAARLTTIRDTKQKNNRQALQTRLDQIRTDKELTINHIAKLSESTTGREELAAKYGGGSWQASRGALHRFSKMTEMTDTWWTPAWYVKWLCRFIMLVFTIIVIGGKRFAPQDWKQYCDRGQQGRAGHLEARNNITLEGFNPDTYGLSSEIKRRLADHFAARQKLVEAHLNLDRKICELTVPDGHSICRTLDQIEGLLHKHWLDEGEKHRLNLVNCEEAMLRDGLNVPIWPATLANGFDLLNSKTPWTIGKNYLAREYAWVDPTESIEERRRIIATYPTYQTNLRNLFTKQAGELQTAIEANPRVPIVVLWRQRQRWLEKSILPILERMETQERRLRQLGGEVPAWPHYFPDPRAEILRTFADLNADELKPLGWTGPEEPGTV
jgi:hypothetical protein